MRLYFTSVLDGWDTVNTFVSSKFSCSLSKSFLCKIHKSVLFRSDPYKTILNLGSKNSCFCVLFNHDRTTMSKSLHKVLEQKLGSIKQSAEDWNSSDDEDEQVMRDLEEEEVNKNDSLEFVKGDDVNGVSQIDAGEGVIYLGHIPPQMEEHELRKFLSQFGDIAKLKLWRSPKTDRPRGYAFVKFAEGNEVAKIVADTLSGYFVMGKRRLVCNLVDKVSKDLFKRRRRPIKNVLESKRYWGLKQNRAFENIVFGKLPDGTPVFKERRQKNVEREEARRAKLAAMGIDFEFNGVKESQQRAAELANKLENSTTIGERTVTTKRKALEADVNLDEPNKKAENDVNLSSKKLKGKNVELLKGSNEKSSEVVSTDKYKVDKSSSKQTKRKSKSHEEDIGEPNTDKIDAPKIVQGKKAKLNKVLSENTEQTSPIKQILDKKAKASTPKVETKAKPQTQTPNEKGIGKFDPSTRSETKKSRKNKKSGRKSM